MAELQKYGGVMGTKQPGFRSDRLRKQEKFREAIINRITRVTMAKLRKGFSRWHSKSVVVDFNQEMEKDLREEVEIAVQQAIGLKSQEIKGFSSLYLRLSSRITTLKYTETCSNKEKSVRNLFYVPNVAFHKYWRENETTRLPLDMYKQVKTDKNDEPLINKKTDKPITDLKKKIPCDDRCSFPKNWEERLWNLLTSIDDETSDVFKRIESLLDFENCNGCIPNTPYCDYDDTTGCRDGLTLLRKLYPHSDDIRKLVDKVIYPARRAAKAMLEIDAALSDACLDLNELQSRIFSIKQKDKEMLEKLAPEKSKKSDGRLGPPLSEKAISEKWATNIAEFKKIESDHPLTVCNFCEEMKRPKFFKLSELKYEDFTMKTKRVKKDEATCKRMWYVFSLTFPDAVTEEQKKAVFPLRVCSHCWGFLKDGRIGGGMKANSMVVDELPDELSKLNVYEKFLIARAHAFYTVIDLKPLGGRKNIPSHLLLKATRGNAVHLPVPTTSTSTRVLDTLPMKDPREALQIYADVPTKSGVTWRNLVDVDKILAALQWLKENNNLYEDITICPEVFKQMDERGFLKLTGENNAPIPPPGDDLGCFSFHPMASDL